jgi:hypothetical protein
MAASVWTRADWNDLIGRINALADEGCDIAEPLEEVPEGHIWSVQDITDARDKLTEICANAPEFSAETVKWTQAIIDELNTAIDGCECGGCEVAYVYMPDETYPFTMTTFGTMEELWNNEHATLIHETEGTNASNTASEKWTQLNDLLNQNPTQEQVDAKVAEVNAAAATAWGYISSADTDRHNYDPLGQWLDTDEIKTAEPRPQITEFWGMKFNQWRMCQTRATIRIEDAGCWGDPPNQSMTYASEYYFTGSPDGEFFFSGSYGVTYGEPNLFARNEDRGCGANFVGYGDCPSVQRCVDYLNAHGIKYTVKVTYETSELWSVGWPV